MSAIAFVAAAATFLLALTLASALRSLLAPHGRPPTSAPHIDAAHTEPSTIDTAGDGTATPGMLGQARSAATRQATRALSANQSVESRVSRKLDAAASQLKPGEWVAIHAGIIVASAALAALLSTGNLLAVLTACALAAVLPWVYLGRRAQARRDAFHSHLADTLQLIAGGLQAGLSLQQSLDTVVKEAPDVVAAEFRRVLVETRLAVPLEDALDDVATRMRSQDFTWVVMAIRIQREVGGNLAELLTTVAATLREREYLRRHVSALSAEGRLSGVILAALPPVFVLYLLLAQPDYVTPMFSDPRGWVLIGAASLMLGLGAFWMSRLVKVEL